MRPVGTFRLLAATLSSLLFTLAGALAQVPTDAVGTIEQGDLRILHVEDYERGRSHFEYFLLPEFGGAAAAMELEFARGAPRSLKPGRKINVKGRARVRGRRLWVEDLVEVESAEEASIQDGAQDGAGGGSLAAAGGAHSTLALLININGTTTWTNSHVTAVENVLYHNGDSVDALFSEGSHGALSFPASQGLVAQPLSIAKIPGCPVYQYAAAADAAAAARGINVTAFQHRIYLFPRGGVSDCNWLALGEVGTYGSTGSYRSWSTMIDAAALGHELGHNLGWHHAATDPDDDGTLNSEYGDVSDMMGYCCTEKKFNAVHLDQIGWLPAGSLLTVTDSGSYSLAPLGTDPAVDPSPQVLRIERSGGGMYYLSYRQATGLDANLGATYTGGLNIHRGAPHDNWSYFIRALTDTNNLFEIPEAGITVAQTWHDATGVGVSISYGGNLPPTAAFTHDCTDLACSFSDASGDSDGSIVDWDWSFGDGYAGSGANPAHSYGAAGSYDVTLTVSDDGGASDSVTQTITVTAPPAPDGTPDADFSHSCDGLTCSFTDGSSDDDGNIVGRVWAFGDGNGSNAANPTHLYGTGGSYSVTLMVTDDDGNSDTISKTVVAADGPLPDGPPTADYSHSCDGLVCSFSDASSGDIKHYSWAFGDGLGATATTSPTHSYGAPGSYDVTLLVTAQDNHRDRVTKTITVGDASPPNAPPSAAFSHSCSDLACSFTDNSSDGDGSIAARSWSFGDGKGSGAVNPNHGYASGGSYSVTLTVTDDDGASDSVTQSVTVTAPPPPNAPPSAAFSHSCSDLACSFIDSSSDGDGSIAARSWTFGDGKGSGAVNPNHGYASGGSYSVTLTVTDDDGASDSVTQSVTVTAPPPPNAPPSAAFSHSCSDLACSFTDSSSDGDGSIAARSWSFGDGKGSGAVNPNHGYASGGSYSVTLTVTDDDGASDSVTQSVTVTAPPPPNAPPSAAFSHSCSDLACSFTDSSSDGDGSIAARSWSFGDGKGSGAVNPNHGYASGGSYSVTLTVTDDDGASDSVTQSVTVTAPPPPNAPPSAAFSHSCSDLACSFTDSSSDGDGSIAARSWSFGDGKGSGAVNPNHGYASGGSYSVTLTVTDDDGASDSVTQSVTVTAEPQPDSNPVADFTHSCDELLCHFSDASTNGDGSIIYYSWAYGDGLGATATATPSHKYGASGSYSVTLLVTDDRGVRDRITKTITVMGSPQQPSGPPSADFNHSCSGLVCSFSDASSGNIGHYSWAYGDGLGATATTNPTHRYGAPGSYDVTLLVTAEDGHRDRVIKTISVGDASSHSNPPSAGFSHSCSDLACSFTDSSSDGDGSIAARSWSFGDGKGSDTVNPNHDYGVGGSYSVTLTVSDDKGASDSVTQTVTVEAPAQGLVISNFTPDTARYRQTFAATIKGSGFAPGAELYLLSEGKQISVRHVVVVDENTITATIRVRKGGRGQSRSWDAVVYVDGETVVLPNAVTITR